MILVSGCLSELSFEAESSMEDDILSFTTKNAPPELEIALKGDHDEWTSVDEPSSVHRLGVIKHGILIGMLAYHSFDINGDNAHVSGDLRTEGPEYLKLQRQVAERRHFKVLLKSEAQLRALAEAAIASNALYYHNLCGESSTRYNVSLELNVEASAIVANLQDELIEAIKYHREAIIAYNKQSK